MRNNAFLVGLFAALCTATYRCLDNYTIHNLIVASDNLTAAFAYLIVGSWVGVISGFIFSLAFGRKLIDPDFTRIIIRNSEMHKQAFISGTISAGSTLFIMLGNQVGDPSVVIALANLTVIYTIFYDIMTRQANFKDLFLPSLLIVLGGIMAAFSGSLSVTFLGFFYIVIVSNGLSAYSEIVEAKGIRASDSVNLYIWRFFWMALVGTVLALSVSLSRGYLELLLETVRGSLVHLPLIVSTMFFVFLGMGLKFFLKKDQAISIVLLVLSTQLFIAYPITVFGSWISPGIFGDVPPNPFVWLIRMAGSTLIVLGIIQLYQRQISSDSY